MQSCNDIYFYSKRQPKTILNENNCPLWICSAFQAFFSFSVWEKSRDSTPNSKQLEDIKWCVKSKKWKALDTRSRSQHKKYFCLKKLFLSIIQLRCISKRRPPSIHSILLPKLFWPTEKNFWNSRLNAENLQNIWDHLNNLFKQWKVRPISGNRILF